MSYERTNEGEPPLWASAALGAVREILANDNSFTHLHTLGIGIVSWCPDKSRVWVNTHITEDGDDLTTLHSLFGTEASVGSLSRDDDGAYIVELLF